MAKIGLNNFRYGLLTENPDGTASKLVLRACVEEFFMITGEIYEE